MGLGTHAKERHLGSRRPRKRPFYPGLRASRYVRLAPTVERMTMKAAVYERYGPLEVLEVREVPKPEPKDDEILVAVGATTVTSACGMMRRGDTLMARLVLGVEPPVRQPETRLRETGSGRLMLARRTLLRRPAISSHASPQPW